MEEDRSIDTQRRKQNDLKGRLTEALHRMSMPLDIAGWAGRGLSWAEIWVERGSEWGWAGLRELGQAVLSGAERAGMSVV
jgi:hypothetical protein